MKINNSYAAMILLLIIICGSDFYAQTWTSKATIPTKRWYPGCAELNGKIYVVGGQGEDSPYSSQNNLEVYDPSTDSWGVLSPMQESRWGAMVVAYGEKIYVIGGLTGSFVNGFTSTNVVEEYNPSTDTWTTKSSMQTERGWGGGVVINDTIYVFGGYKKQSGQDLSTIEKYYPPDDVWTLSSITMPSARSTFMTAKVNDNIYLIGGWGSNLVEEYNVISSKWHSKSTLPVATGGGGVAVDDSLIYIIGGRSTDFNEFQCYNTKTDLWTLLTPMPTPREGLVSAIVNKKVYSITGSAPSGFPYISANEEAKDIISDANITYNQPVEFYLYQNYPNPFNPGTRIEYSLKKPEKVSLSIYNLQGKEIKTLINEYQSAGKKSVYWNGKDNSGNEVASGIYFYEIQSNNYNLIKKMILLR